MELDPAFVAEELRHDADRRKIAKILACPSCLVGFSAAYPEGISFVTCPRCGDDVDTD